MDLWIKIDGDTAEALRRWSREKLPEQRAEGVERLMHAALRATLAGNPVDTGRSRAAWAATLEAWGRQPPPGWEGHDREAMNQGRSRSRRRREQTFDQTELQASNGVNYVQYLEYGTRRQPPAAMVRRALEQTRRLVAQAFVWRRS